MGESFGLSRQTIVALLTALLLTVWPFSHAQATLEGQAEHGDTTADRDNPFPLPPALEPAVEFWSKVFGVWRRDQLVLHDEEHLGVVYRVVPIPGTVAEGLSTSQRIWMRQQEANLASQLRMLAYNEAAGRPLSSQEQALYAAIQQGGGSLKGAADRVRSQRGTRERFLRGLEISSRYDRAFREVFRSQGLPEDLAYLPHVESSFQIGARSSVGAAGMWQFMPKTARSFMTVTSAVDERLNPIAAAQGAARYFAGAYQQLGNWPLAVTSYNHGIGSMRRAQQLHGNDFARIVRDYDSPSFGFASRNFYPEFLAARRIAQNPERYFPEGVHVLSPLAVRPLVLQRATHAHDISRQSGTHLTQLSDLNPGWSDRVLTGKAKLPAGVTVWLPTGKNTTLSQLAEPAHTSSTSGRSTRQHRVAKGDSLWSIARRYDTTVAALSVYNGLDAGTAHLKIGQTLNLPATRSTRKISSITLASVTPQTHRVGQGDTPFGIATTYRITLRDLLAANNLHERSVIRPGQKLLIPNKP